MHVVVAMEDTDLLAIEEAWQCRVVVGVVVVVVVVVVILKELLCCSR